jgi:trehalose-6-phosphatase
MIFKPREAFRRLTMLNITPVQLEQNLGILNYPATKQDLIKNAEEHGADEKILRALKKMPSKQYETIAAVSQTLSEIPL